MINSIPSLLYLACMVLALPCALLAALVLGLRKGGVHKGLWTAVCILSLLCALGMMLVEGIALFQATNGMAGLIRQQWVTNILLHALKSLVCIVPALIFPLTLNGRRDGLKALLLVPAILLSICSMFKYKMAGFLPMLMVYLPLLAVVLLAAIRAFSGRKTALGILMALGAAGCLLTLPMLSAMAGHSLQTLNFAPLQMLRSLSKLFSAVFSAPFTLVQLIRFTGLPLPAYALLALLTTAGLIGAKLPGKATADKPKPKAAPQPAPQPAPKAAPAPRFCMQCGAPLDADAKFCNKCGSPVK